MLPTAVGMGAIVVNATNLGKTFIWSEAELEDKRQSFQN